ncbi:MAG: hypothetical protein KF749_04365 [Bacteroidetes bacterium]|nr:hypothetical protein [Bacteroidota bacterium]MCW5897611.1 hypothetical protein [Bacteroidota bacterium]
MNKARPNGNRYDLAGLPPVPGLSWQPASSLAGLSRFPEPIRHRDSNSLNLSDLVPRIFYSPYNNYNRKAGDQILIHATDDFEVTKVDVAIYNSNGETIESGLAVKSTADPDQWMYTVALSHAGGGPLAVVASAADRPGNVTSHAEAN